MVLSFLHERSQQKMQQKTQHTARTMMPIAELLASADVMQSTSGVTKPLGFLQMPLSQVMTSISGTWYHLCLGHSTVQSDLCFRKTRWLPL